MKDDKRLERARSLLKELVINWDYMDPKLPCVGSPLALNNLVQAIAAALPKELSEEEIERESKNVLPNQQHTIDHEIGFIAGARFARERILADE